MTYSLWAFPHLENENSNAWPTYHTKLWWRWDEIMGVRIFCEAQCAVQIQRNIITNGSNILMKAEIGNSNPTGYKSTRFLGMCRWQWNRPSTTLTPWPRTRRAVKRKSLLEVKLAKSLWWIRLAICTHKPKQCEYLTDGFGNTQTLIKMVSRGAWVAQLVKRLTRLGSPSHGLWVRASRRALCWRLGPWSLFQILCLPLSLCPSQAHEMSLSVSKINKH